MAGDDRRSATPETSSMTARARCQYDAYASRYDRETSYYERLMLGDGRSWACSQAHGEVLEVAIGTGRNLAHYPPDIRLVGVGFLSRQARVASTLVAMTSRAGWLANMWLLYLVAGAAWVTVGLVVLGGTSGLGLIWVGLVCLSFGLSSAAWRLRHGYRLTRALPARPGRCH